MSDEAKFKQAIADLNKLREERGVDINGKLYSKVIDRVEMFRSTFGAEYGIDTSVDYSRGFNRGAVIVVTAKVGDVKTGITVASGTAMCYVGSDEVTETSSIEATETAAIGRALACFGLAGGEFASANEMATIDTKKQSMPAEPRGMTNQQNTIPDIGGSFAKYMPQKGAQLDLDREVSLITDEVSQIHSESDLTQYWTELRDFRNYLDNRDTELYSSLKAAFAVQAQQIKGPAQ